MQHYDISINNTLTVPQSCIKPSAWCGYDLSMEFSELTGPDDVCLEWMPFLNSLDSYSPGNLVTLVFYHQYKVLFLCEFGWCMYMCIILVWVSPGIHLLHYSTWWDLRAAVIVLDHASRRIITVILICYLYQFLRKGSVSRNCEKKKWKHISRFLRKLQHLKVNQQWRGIYPIKKYGLVIIALKSFMLTWV